MAQFFQEDGARVMHAKDGLHVAPRGQDTGARVAQFARVGWVAAWRGVSAAPPPALTADPRREGGGGGIARRQAAPRSAAPPVPRFEPAGRGLGIVQHARFPACGRGVEGAAGVAPPRAGSPACSASVAAGRVAGRDGATGRAAVRLSQPPR